MKKPLSISELISHHNMRDNDRPLQIRKARRYFTLAEFSNNRWAPQFGDYDREIVQYELEDYRDHDIAAKNLKIVTSGDSQAEINAAVATLVAPPLKIKLSFSSCDGGRWTKTFKSIVDARAAIIDQIGQPELGSTYAISGDGICKVQVAGDATLNDLFPRDAS